MFELNYQAAPASLLVIESLGDCVDWAGGNFGSGKFFQRCCHWFLLKDFLQQRHQDFAVLDSERVGGESFVAADFVLNVHHLYEASPERFCSHANDKILFIAAAKRFVGDDVRMSVAPAFWGNAGIQVAAPSVRQPGKLRIE